MKFKGDIIITDPCYVIKDEDWLNFLDTWTDAGEPPAISYKGLDFLIRDTEYGDWGCTTFSNGKKIGEFCADAGLVAVFYLPQVLEYNPQYDDHIKKEFTTTWIKNFNGDVEIVRVNLEENFGNGPIDSTEVRVIGRGNISFYTTQTSL